MYQKHTELRTLCTVFSPVGRSVGPCNERNIFCLYVFWNLKIEFSALMCCKIVHKKVLKFSSSDYRRSPTTFFQIKIEFYTYLSIKTQFFSIYSFSNSFSVMLFQKQTWKFWILQNPSFKFEQNLFCGIWCTAKFNTISSH